MISIFEVESIKEFRNAMLVLFIKTAFIVIISSITSCACVFMLYSKQNKNNVEKVEVNDKKLNIEEWKLCVTDAEATVYNAVPTQCNKDFGVTASMFYLDLYNVEAHKIIAMERTFMKEFGLVYGDVIKIEGVGVYDGVYQIQDTMNKRFAGKHKIDILVNESIKCGKWTDVKIYMLKDKSKSLRYTSTFKPEITKQENKIQMKQKRKDWKKC